MAGPIDTFLKVSTAAAALFAAASVGYYFLLYLPQRDAQLDRERRLDAARIEYSRQAEQARISAEKANEQARAAAEKHDLEARQEVAREAIQTRYRSCVRNAEINYSSAWAEGCKQQSDRASKAYRNCMKDPNNSFCDTLYSERANLSLDCSLPRALGTDISESLDKARKRCLDESQAGLQ
jgi:hypothetical protein